jgi:hypothetical protein
MEFPKFFIIHYNSTVVITKYLSLITALAVIQHIISVYRLISTSHAEKVLNTYNIFATLKIWDARTGIMCTSQSY